MSVPPNSDLFLQLMCLNQKGGIEAERLAGRDMGQVVEEIAN